MENIKIKKRDGRMEDLDLEKIHKVLGWVCDGLTGVSISELELKSQLSFYDGMWASQIQETLIKTAGDLITEDAPNYQYVAGRLVSYHLRKEIYGGIVPPSLLDHVKSVTAKGYYDAALLEKYSEDEFGEINKFINHAKDDNFTYAAMEQFRGKYLVKDRYTGKIYETPQFCYVLIAMFLFMNYPKENRLRYVKQYYQAISDFYISLPTPIMSGVRTPNRQFSSCVLIESGDSLDSIFTTAHAIGRYVSQKAGIGVNGGALRAAGSSIRGGAATHTGVVPFYRLWQSSVKSCSQGGVRGGAATLYYPFWHYEIQDLLVLKNNKGTEMNRLRQLDYCVQFNKLFYERIISGGTISLFSPADVPGLYESFFSDQLKFKELYETAENNPDIRKHVVSAMDIFASFIQERTETGRVYLMNVDHANEHGSFKPDVAPIRQSNLCAEITLPTKPLEHIDDENGEISLCTLSAINWGLIHHPSEFEKYCDLAVRALDALLDIQDYPVKAAYISTMNRRPLGIGIINFAYWLAKNDLKYDDITEDGLALIDEYAQHWSYYMISASLQLAQEKGACPLSNQTKYSDGVLPVDTYKKDVDTLLPHKDVVDWEGLRVKLKDVGIRNSTLMALMPAETSAQISNATNGMEPPRALVSVKQSKDGVLRQVVPEIRRLKNKYNLLWDQKSPFGYLKIAAVMNKYLDQTGSWNTSWNPQNYKDEQIPMSDMINVILLTYKWGLKTLYYNNVYDGAGEANHELPSVSETTSTSLDQEECSACVI